jgi:hypothetical protein
VWQRRYRPAARSWLAQPSLARPQMDGASHRVHAALQTPIGVLDVYSIRPRPARLEIAAGRNKGLRQRLREYLDDLRSGRLADITRVPSG